jgi:hypothetical protein
MLEDLVDLQSLHHNILLRLAPNPRPFVVVAAALAMAAAFEWALLAEEA